MTDISKVFLYKNKTKKTQTLELVNYLIMILVLIVTGVSIYSLTYLRLYAEEVPTEEKIKANLENKGENSKIFDRHGEQLYTFKDPDRDREYVTYDEIPRTIVVATLAAEDKDFFVHGGIDFVASIKGIYTTLTSSGDKVIGGSTITQQLVKQTLLSNEQTFDRKIKEAIIAMNVERDYDKEQILEYYLNVSNYGGRVQGIKTASLTYFDKPLEELDINEAAFLVGLVQSPGEYSPLYANDKVQAHKLSGSRRKFILEQIASNPRLLAYLNGADTSILKTAGQYELVNIDNENADPLFTKSFILDHQKVDYHFEEPVDQLKAPHWVFYIRSILQEEPYNLSINELYSGGYQIYTSLDYGVQKIAEQKLKEGVELYGPRYNFENGSLVGVDPNSGEIITMVGSKDYFLPNDPNNKKFDPEVNVATANQSLGSSLKPWVAYQALATGKYKAGTIVKDSPQTFYKSYKPKNSDGKFMGDITLRIALLESRNLPFLKISYKLGDQELPNLMKKIGYRTDTQYGLAATVGGVDETLLDHVGAYTGLANGGTVMQKKPILRITKQDAGQKYTSNTRVKYELNRDAVAGVNSILGDKSYTRGTYRYKFIGNNKLAGKTGTSDSNKDTYYIGYGPKLALGVWTGNNDNTRMVRSAFGSSTALPIWNHVMGGILSQYPEYGEPGRY